MKSSVLCLLIIFVFLFLTPLSKADLKYLSNIPVINAGGIDYRALSDAPVSFTSVVNYTKTVGKYIVDPANQSSTLRGNPDSGIPIGYGWVTPYNFSGPLLGGFWNFSTTVISNKNDIGYLGFSVYKTCSGNNIKLFGTSMASKVTDGSGVARNYYYTYNAPFLDVTGCSLKIEYWVNMTSAALSNTANLVIVHGSSTWIQFPGVFDIIPPTYSLNSVSSIIAGIPITHSLYWTDNVALGGYIFSFDNGTGNFVNDSFAKFSGISNWSNVTKVVASTPGTTIRWCIYARDLAGNWNGDSCLNPFTYVVIQAPSISIQKKIVENLITQNKAFTVQVLFQNIGGGNAFNITINDSIPPDVTIISGDAFWAGQLASGEGNGFIYTAIPKQQGYLNLGGATAIYLDAGGAAYSSSSNSVQLYVESAPPPQRPSIFDLLDDYSKPLQVIGVMLGVIASIYSFIKLRKGPVEKRQRGVKQRRKRSKSKKWGAIRNDLQDIIKDLEDIFAWLFNRK